MYKIYIFKVYKIYSLKFKELKKQETERIMNLLFPRNS